jgi:hypothetical protein
LGVFTEFEYVEQGVKIHDRWHPILKMAWVEGATLDAFVAQFLETPAVLDALADLWARFTVKLQDVGVAHGDLSHGNVLLVHNRTTSKFLLRLVDYDGMYVPGLSVGGPRECGHPNYQHPQRVLDGTHNLEIDRFSHLVIYTALKCLSRGGRALWDRYDDGENLLFTRRDFEEPQSSKLFNELWRASGPERGLVGRLALACVGRLEDVPSLSEVLGDGALPTLTGEEEKRVVDVLSRKTATPPPDPVVEWWLEKPLVFYAKGERPPPPVRCGSPSQPIVKWWMSPP